MKTILQSGKEGKTMKKIMKKAAAALMTAMLLACFAVLFQGGSAEAAEKAPSLPKLVTTNPSAWSRTFKITNLKKTDKVIKVVSKDEKIVEAGWFNDEKVLILSTINCAKTGETDVIVKVKRNKKTYSLKVHVNSKAWETPFKKLKVGTKDLTNRATGLYANLPKRSYSGKLVFRLKAGWKLVDLRMQDNVTGDSKKIKNYAKVNLKKSTLVFTVKNAKTNHVMTFNI